MDPAANPAPAAEPPAVSRRTAIAGAVAVTGVAGVTMAACDSGGTESAAGTVLGKAADVEVGGGVIHREAEIVVTQPKKGEFKAFSARCTHQGCIVENVSNEEINCGCHKSRFRIADGSVAKGPATKPLPARTVTVNDNGQIVTA